MFDFTRRQRAVKHVFNSGHLKDGIYTKGTGQQKTNSRGANDFGDGKRADNGIVCGIPHGGADLGLPETIPEEPGSSGDLLVIDTWRWS
jgi:hypothetical protein